MKICVHTIVRNEDLFLWFAVMSVIDHVDKVMIWDTGSTDNTHKIMKEIKNRYPEKVDLSYKNAVDPMEFTLTRKEMLDLTKEDWIILVDADEVWWEDQITALTDFIHNNGRKYETIVSRYTNLVGDIYHSQEEIASRYTIDGIRGNLTIRAMNKDIPGLTIDRPHGTQSFFDKDGIPIQERNIQNRYHDNGVSYLHFTHLMRSSSLIANSEVPKRSFKHKSELGLSLSSTYYYPEVFFRPKPNCVKSPWVARSRKYELKSYPLTILRKMKRRFLPGKDGY